MLYIGWVYGVKGYIRCEKLLSGVNEHENAKENGSCRRESSPTAGGAERAISIDDVM